MAIGNRIEDLARSASVLALTAALVAASPAVAQDQQTPEQAAAAHDAYLKQVLKGTLTPKPDYLPYPPNMPVPKHVCAADKARLLASAQERLEIALQNLGMARLYARDGVASGTLRPDEAAREIGSKQSILDSIHDLIGSLERLPLAPDCAPPEQDQGPVGQTPAQGGSVGASQAVSLAMQSVQDWVSDFQNQWTWIDTLQQNALCDEWKQALHDFENAVDYFDSPYWETTFAYDHARSENPELDRRIKEEANKWRERIARMKAEGCGPKAPPVDQPPPVGQTPATPVTPIPAPTPVAAPPVAPSQTPGLSAYDKESIDRQQSENALVEKMLMDIEAARQRGDCDSVLGLSENLERILAGDKALELSFEDEDLSVNLHADFPPETLASWRRRLDEIRGRPCPPAGAADGENILGEITTPKDLLQEHGDEPPAPPTEAERARVTREFGQALFMLFSGGRTEVPGTTAGVVRTDADEELPAGSCTGDLDFFGIGGWLAFPGGATHVFVEGHYSEADAKTCPFSVEPGSAEAAGFSFGQEADGSTGLILGDYAGEDGSIRRDLDDISIKVGVEIPLVGQAAQTPGEMPAPVRVSLAPFLQYQRRNTHYDSYVTMTTNLPDFKPDIGQNRRQNVGEDHFVAGGQFDLYARVGDHFAFRLQGSAGIDFLRGSLHSVEHNHCDVCGADLEDFTIDTHDRANDTRLRGGLGAAFEVLLASHATASVGGRLDFVPSRLVENPVTGDDVLGGKTTGMGRVYDELDRYIFAGVTLDF